MHEQSDQCVILHRLDHTNATIQASLTCALLRWLAAPLLPMLSSCTLLCSSSSSCNSSCVHKEGGILTLMDVCLHSLLAVHTVFFDKQKKHPFSSALVQQEAQNT